MPPHLRGATDTQRQWADQSLAATGRTVPRAQPGLCTSQMQIELTGKR